MRRHWLFTAVLSFVLLAGAGAGIYVYQMYASMNETLESVHEPIQRQAPSKRTSPVVIKQRDPISILLLGVDEREGDRGRSDSLVLVTVNPEENTTKLISIPRDTYADIVGKKKKDKLNHAYAYGGVPMTVSTVESLLDIPIDYYIEVNMKGFQDIVDAVEGVVVNNTFPFSYEGSTFSEGLIHLNGAEALSYARMRKEDPDGDFGRQKRQRQVVEAVLQKGVSFSTFTRYKDILQAVRQNVKTNITADDIYDMQQAYKEAAQHVEQLKLEGEGGKKDGIWYYFLSDKSKETMSRILRKHLRLDV